MTAGLPLIKNVLTPLAKSLLILLGLTAAALVISNEEMEDMKIVKLLEESGLLTKGISEANENEAKEQKDRFFPVLIGTLAVILLGSALTDKE